MAASDVSDADELYQLDPGDFVAARNALAKRLRADGEREEAARVAKLRRPSAPAWALNRLAHDEPDLLASALEAGERLRRATEAAMGGDADDLRPATAAEQAASDAAVDAASAHLGERGPDLRLRVAATLRAAVLDEEVADRLRRGVLETDHEASGFGFAASLDVGAGDDASAAGRERAREREERERRRQLEGRLRELETRAEDLARDADRQEAAAREVRERADRAAAEVEQVRAELDDS